MRPRSLVLIAFVGLLLITGIFYTTRKKFFKPSYELSQKQDSLQLVDDVFISPKREGLSQFSLKIPKGWEVRNFDGGKIFSVELVNGNYSLQIFQPYEGSTCVFPGDKPYEGPSEVFDKEMVLRTQFGTIKIGRSSSDLYGEKVIFIACSQIYAYPDNGQTYFGTGTQIGNIQYFVPKNYSENKIKEMNELLQTIKLVK